MRAGDDDDRTRRIHTNGRAFEHAAATARRHDELRGARAAGFDVARDADAAQLAALLRFRAALLEAGVITELDRLGDDLGIIARVIFGTKRSAIRKRSWPDEIAPTQFDLVDAEIACGLIDDAFDHIRGLGTARTAISIHRHGVGPGTLHVAVGRRDDVGAAEHRRVVIRGDCRPERGVVRAHVGLGADAQREELRVLVERELDMCQVIAAMTIADERLAAIRSPVHGTADALRRPQHDHVFVVMKGLRAEAAADIRRDHADLGFRRLQRGGGQQHALHVRILRGQPERVLLLAVVVLAGGGARLHRVADHAAVDEIELRDMRRLRERGFGGRLVADLPVERDVARRLAPDLRRARCERAIDRGDDRQIVDVELDQFSGVLRLQQRLGDDHRDRLADMAHAIHGHGRMRRIELRLAADVLSHPATGQITDTIGLQVCADEHVHDTRRGLGSRDIESLDDAMRHLGSQDVGLGLARADDVVGVATLAGDEPLVFDARDRGPKSGAAHGNSRSTMGL